MTDGKKKNRKRRDRSASPLSRVLASSANGQVVRLRYFEHLTPGQIRASFPQIAAHRHFSKATFKSPATPDSFYKSATPPTSFEKNIAWCLALVEQHRSEINTCITADAKITDAILSQNNKEALEILDEVDAVVGMNMWSTILRGALFNASGLLEEKRQYITNINEKAGNNRFFKGVLHLKVSRQDEAEISLGDARYF